MSGFTIGWGLLALAGLVLEGIALVNSGRGDTLSEHVWAFLGVRRKGDGSGKVTPKWTLRLARFSFVSAAVWLVVHLTTNWM